MWLSSSLVFPFVIHIFCDVGPLHSEGSHLTDAVIGEVDGGVAETLDGRGMKQRCLQQIDDVALVEDGHVKLETSSLTFHPFSKGGLCWSW